MTRAPGFSPTRDGLLACPHLRVAADVLSATRYDWVHTFLADGLVSSATRQLVSAAERAGIANQSDICEFLKQKSFPPTPDATVASCGACLMRMDLVPTASTTS